MAKTTTKRVKSPPTTASDVEAMISHLKVVTHQLGDEFAKMKAGTAERDAEIETLRDAKKQLDDRNDELLGKVDDPEKEVAKLADAEHIREQLERLATDTDRPCAPQTTEQWSRCLREILAGRDWELMTWR